jgi:hypothetical protein
MASCTCCAGGTAVNEAFSGEEVPQISRHVIARLDAFIDTQTSLKAQIRAIEDATELTPELLHELQVLIKQRDNSLHQFIKLYTETQANVLAREMTFSPTPDGGTLRRKEEPTTRPGVEELVQSLIKTREPAAASSVASDPEFAPWSLYSS